MFPLFKLICVRAPQSLDDREIGPQQLRTKKIMQIVRLTAKKKLIDDSNWPACSMHNTYGNVMVFVFWPVFCAACTYNYITIDALCAPAIDLCGSCLSPLGIVDRTPSPKRKRREQANDNANTVERHWKLAALLHAYIYNTTHYIIYLYIISVVYITYYIYTIYYT